MIIKQATSEDIAEILNLQKLAYKSEAEIYNNYRIQPLTQTIDEIICEFNTRTFIKAVHDGIIVGSVRAHVKNDTCFVGKLIVHPNYQNQGIGSALMAKIENIFSDTRRYELFTGHRSLRNLYLYKKLGYKEFKREVLSNNITHVFMEKHCAT